MFAMFKNCLRQYNEAEVEVINMPPYHVEKVQMKEMHKPSPAFHKFIQQTNREDDW